jgi:NADPH2:quinone reductase
MKAAVYYENGGPSVLRYEDVANPVCSDDGVIIRVVAISIEGGDTLSRLGGALVSKPHIVGYQAAGEVIEVGENVNHLRAGQMVTTLDAFGSHAELRAVSARNCWPVPAGLDPKIACVVPVAFGAADECLFEFGRLRAGETVLVQAGASGVGVAAIQLSNRAGATVVATASHDDRLARLRPLGMDHGINYRKDDVVESVMRLTNHRGVDLVVDCVGGATLEGSIRSLGYRGRVAMVGAAGREPMRVDVSSMIGGSRSLFGVFLGAEISTDRVHDSIQRLLNDVARGDLRVLVDRVFPLSHAADAHAYVESRQAVGRVLLIP